MANHYIINSKRMSPFISFDVKPLACLAICAHNMAYLHKLTGTDDVKLHDEFTYKQFHTMAAFASVQEILMAEEWLYGVSYKCRLEICQEHPVQANRVIPPYVFNCLEYFAKPAQFPVPTFVPSGETRIAG